MARTAAQLTGYGVHARHLRTVQAAVEREITLIEHVVAPILKQRGAGAREPASRTAGELAGLALRLHRALIEGALAEAGLAEGSVLAADPAGPAGHPAAEQPRRPNPGGRRGGRGERVSRR